MPAKEAWGLDIGQSAIRLVKMHRGRGNVKITDYAVRPIETYPDDPDYEEKVQEILFDVADEYSIGGKPVVVSLSGFSTLFRDFPLPSISASKLDEIVSYEAKQQIPYPLEEVLWDYHQYRADEDSPELNIALVCCRRDIVEKLLLVFEDLNLNIVAVQMGPVALANFLLYDQPPEGVSLVLDCGARSTEFLIINNNSFWQRSISVAGNDITKALMKKFNLPFNDAEDMKKKMGESKQGERVFSVVKPTFRTLAGEIQRSMGYYKSLYRGVTVEHIIAAGRSFRMPSVDQFAANEIGIAVTKIAELGYIELDDGIDEDDFNENIDSLGTAIGLALQGVGESDININLLPPEIQQKHLIKQKLPFAIAATVLIIAMTVISLIYAMERSTRWKGLNEKMESFVSSKGRVDMAKNKLRNAENKFGPAEEKNLALGKVAVNRGDMPEALSTILTKISDINKERRQQVEQSGELEKYVKRCYDEVLDPIDGNQAVKEFFEKVSDEAERKKLEDIIMKACRKRAKRITDRRRRVIIEDIDIKSVDETWYRERLDGNKLGPILTPSELNEELEKLKGNRDSDRKIADKMKKMQEIPVPVCVISVKGFSVNEQVELKDVMILKNKFLELPEVISIDFQRNTDRITNDLPVVKPKYVKEKEKEGYQDSYMSVSNTEDKKEDKIEWEIYKEPILAFNIVMKYLPMDRFNDIKTKRGELADKPIRSLVSEIDVTSGKNTERMEPGRRSYGRRGR